MQKKTHDYDNVFKTMKNKHRRLFIPVINDIFKKDYLLDVKVDVLSSEGYLTENETWRKQQRNCIISEMKCCV